MGQILPTIKETIAIENSTFVDRVKDTLRLFHAKGWKVSFIVDNEGNELTIRTKRSIQIPYDSAILRGTMIEGQFSYEIKPRKILLFLVPWYLFMVMGLVASIVATLSNINGLIAVLFFAAMIFISWRNISINYSKDLILLQKAMEQNKKHST